MSDGAVSTEAVSTEAVGTAVEFVPMVGDDVRMWLPESMAYYQAARIRAGDTEAQAAAAAADSERRFFTDGAPNPDQVLLTVLADGEDAGWLWIGPWSDDRPGWWVWDIHVREPFRRRGIGRAAMQHAEQLARENGSPSLMLNVFAFNVPAIELYEGLGFEAGALTMIKNFDTPEG